MRREFQLSEETSQVLHHAQLDALELACMDCCFEMMLVDFNPEHFNNKDSLEAHAQAVYMFSEVEFAQLIADTEPHSELRDLWLPRVVLLNTSSGKYTETMISQCVPRFTVGLLTPLIMRATVGAILEHFIGAGFRGLLPRMSNPTNVRTLELKLASSAERSDTQDQVNDFSRDEVKRHKHNAAQGVHQYPKSIGDIVDELLMNAIWDANPEIHHDDRRLGVELPPGKEIKVECYCDGANLALSVEDPYGTFPAQALRKPLAYALGLKPNIKVNEGPGGAGLGLFMILQRTPIMTIEVDHGRYTRVTIIMRLDESIREMQSRPKTLLLFEKPAV